MCHSEFSEPILFLACSIVYFISVSLVGAVHLLLIVSEGWGASAGSVWFIEL